MSKRPRNSSEPRAARPRERSQRTPDAPEGTPREQWLHGAIRIVFEDDDLIVVDKPTGMGSVAPPGQQTPNVFDRLKDYVRDRQRRRGTRVWVIHRLDKEASGLLVFAKTERAFAWLKEEFRAKRVHRLYSAVVEGAMPASGANEGPVPPWERAPLPSGTIQSFLYEDARGLVHSVDAPHKVPQLAREHDEDDRDGPKAAVTHWTAQKIGMGRSLVQVKLETGRKNQIRVHLASLGRPIVGDRRYGAQTDPIRRVCLHAFELGFSHPDTGEMLQFRSPTPGSFYGLVGRRDQREDPRPSRHDVVQRETELADSAAPSPAEPEQAPPPARGPVEHAGPQATTPTSSDQSWNHVAGWYDELIEERGSDHHERLILPGTLRLLEAKPGERVLDVACGQGNLCRKLGAAGVRAVGIDAAPRLIEAARRISVGDQGATPEYFVGDARTIASGVSGPFNAASCVMALMNIDPLSPVLRGIASLLAPGGRFVGVILHPAFRAPGQTRWGWEEHKPKSTPPKSRTHRGGAIPVTQYRRVDGYLSLGQREIVMNPGATAKGKPAITTVTYHRPIQAYVRAFAEAGLLIDALEEWPSLRVSQPGPRAEEENRSRREIPMFLAIRGVRPRG